MPQFNDNFPELLSPKVDIVFIAYNPKHFSENFLEGYIFDEEKK
jgi:hypothetical protein